MLIMGRVVDIDLTYKKISIMLTRLANLFGIKSNERTLVLLLVIHSFFVGMPRTLGISVATGSLSGNLVPIALMFSAILAMLVTVVMDKLQERMKFLPLAHMNLISQALSLGIFYAIFIIVGSDNAILNLAFFVWIQVILVLSYREYWGLARKLMDIRQSKRLFALISSGEVVFAMSMGVLNQLTPDAVYHLLPFGIVGIIGSIVVVMVIGRRFAHLLAETKSSRGRRRSSVSSSEQLSFSSYLILILGLTIIYAIAFGLIRQIYIGALETQYPIKQDRVAFVLILTAITNTFNLFVRLVLADNIMGRFGVAGGLLLLPIGVLLSSGAIAAVYLFNPSLGADALTFFWLVIVLRGNVFVLKSSLDRPASLILLQTFSEQIGQRILNLVTGIVDPLATGLTGLVLFLLTRFVFAGALPPKLLTFSLIIATLIWIAVVLFTLREYAASVLQVLQRRQIGAFSDLFQDKRNLNRIKMNLKSDSPMEVIYALDVLDKLEDPLLNEALKELLKHHDDLVRSEVLSLIEKNRIKDLLPQISLIAQREPQEDVRAIAVRALSALSEDEAFDVLMKYLKSRYPHIRTNAIIGLLRSGDLTGIITAGNDLMALVKSEIVEDRVQAATILGEVGNRDFYRLLVDLLQDESVLVRNAALISAGKLKNPKLWPLVINCLTQHETRSTAVRALHEADESVLDQFEPFFEDRTTSPAVLITLTRICSRMGGEDVRLFLIVHSDVSNLNVRKYVLAALAELDYQAETAEGQQRITAHIYDELNFATWCMAATIALRVYEEKTEFVIKALLEEIAQAEERVFFWLSFIYDTQTLLNAKAKMEIASSNEWALILEALDQTLESELRLRVLPFYERLGLDERYTRMSQYFPQDASADGLNYLDYIIGEEESGLTRGCGQVLFMLHQKLREMSIFLMRCMLRCALNIRWLLRLRYGH